MKKFGMRIFGFAFALTAAALSQTAGAITATKEYVDRKAATNAAAIAVLDGVVSNHTEHLFEIDLRFETTPTLGDVAAVEDKVLGVERGLATNVASIVTNETVSGFTDWIISPPYDDGNYYISYEEQYKMWMLHSYEYGPVDGASGPLDATYLHFDGVGASATRSPIKANALGLARLADLPTNHVTRAELDRAIADIPVPEIDTSTLATKRELSAVSNESQIVYRLFSGSNVVCEVTNYNSVVHAPELRLLQLNESNEYFTVWAETNGLARTLAAANSNAVDEVNALRDEVAPRAWSRVTSGLGAEAPLNTTWISTPTTVIAGGLEYAKVVHANGAVWVLSGNGMMTFDPTTNAYLRISADDGTDIFSIEKSDAVTVGAYAEGITVGPEDGYPVVVSIPVPVVSADHPTAQFRLSLASGEWKDETEWNGVVGSGADVLWSGSSGAWVCKFVVMNAEDMPASAFFRFSYQQPGATVIRNGASVDVSAGGILCTDGVHKCRPVYSGGSITWEVVP